MRIRTLIMLIAALGAAGAAAGGAQNWIAGQRALLDAELAAREPPPPEKVTAIEILVAGKNLPIGTFARLDQFEWRPFPEDGVAESYVIRDGFEESELDGAVLRAGLTAGDPLTRGRLVRPGEQGFLAAVLQPGLRAVSVPINATTGISGFVFPGDAVDLLLTHRVKLGGVERRATETLLYDIRVLAVDQRTNDQEGEPTLAKTATLEVDPRQAETIAVAMEMGRLSLALRAIAQNPDAPAAATPFEPRPRPFGPMEPVIRKAVASAAGGYRNDIVQQGGGAAPSLSGRRSGTITRDSDISRLISAGGAVAKSAPSTKVEIIRAGAVEAVTFTNKSGGE